MIKKTLANNLKFEHSLYFLPSSQFPYYFSMAKYSDKHGRKKVLVGLVSNFVPLPFENKRRETKCEFELKTQNNIPELIYIVNFVLFNFKW